MKAFSSFVPSALYSVAIIIIWQSIGGIEYTIAEAAAVSIPICKSCCNEMADLYGSVGFGGILLGFRASSCRAGCDLDGAINQAECTLYPQYCQVGQNFIEDGVSPYDDDDNSGTPDVVHFCVNGALADSFAPTITPTTAAPTGPTTNAPTDRPTVTQKSHNSGNDDDSIFDKIPDASLYALIGVGGGMGMAMSLWFLFFVVRKGKLDSPMFVTPKKSKNKKDFFLLTPRSSYSTDKLSDVPTQSLDSPTIIRLPSRRSTPPPRPISSTKVASMKNPMFTWGKNTPSGKLPLFVMKYNFDAEENDELTMRVGEKGLGIKHVDKEWWVVRKIPSGKTGLVPAAYMEEVIPDEVPPGYNGSVRIFSAGDTDIIPDIF
eukprot:CAMPEP_0204874832 /NCGR_PEP_ID=MMETSP1348-20121228/44225_1 /ASSEMBLY_ACC=CAM_ASM_000700 /TAXON_ID=215587 /ORGANISM="Aplanochytrium stocchinoi, Strain GSBS06" /LENGTH=374 /DNA_ID=CAMNT_0052030905 /DNA_START=191 /DNA_END=1315 /DNA_ORIENTATION=-